VTRRHHLTSTKYSAVLPDDKRDELLRVGCVLGVMQRSSADAAAHVLKHGLLSVAAMTGGGGIGCPAGTTITGASSGSAGGTESGTESMLGLVQFSVDAEQLPARLQRSAFQSCFGRHGWWGLDDPMKHSPGSMLAWIKGNTATGSCLKLVL